MTVFRYGTLTPQVMEMSKAFSTTHKNQVVLTFPNGNSVSAIWIGGSYSENHDKVFEPTFDFNAPLESDNVEVMILAAPENAAKRIAKKLKHRATGNEFDPYSHVTIHEWLYIVNQLSKPVPINTPIVRR